MTSNNLQVASSLNQQNDEFVQKGNNFFVNDMINLNGKKQIVMATF